MRLRRRDGAASRHAAGRIPRLASRITTLQLHRPDDTLIVHSPPVLGRNIAGKSWLATGIGIT